jgi:hypothetical protein
MIQKTVKRPDGGVSIHYYDAGVLHSVNPATDLFGLTYFYLMIPPQKPKSVLILGYAGGTIANLIKLVWGDDVEITGVDLSSLGDDSIIEKDGFKFVDKCVKFYDYVVVDMFTGGEVDQRVYSKRFLRKLAAISNLVAINLFYDPEEAIIFDKYFTTLIKKEQRGNTVYFLQPKESDVQL